MISVPLLMISLISMASPRVFHIFTVFLDIPVPVYTNISHSPSETMETESRGRVKRVSQPILFCGKKLIIALFQMYACHSGTAILTVERRFAFATVERAIMVPLRFFSSTIISTD